MIIFLRIGSSDRCIEDMLLCSMHRGDIYKWKLSPKIETLYKTPELARGAAKGRGDRQKETESERGQVGKDNKDLGNKS